MRLSRSGFRELRELRELELAAAAALELELGRRLDLGAVYVRRHPATLEREGWREGRLAGDGPREWLDGAGVDELAPAGAGLPARRRRPASDHDTAFRPLTVGAPVPRPRRARPRSGGPELVETLLGAVVMLTSLRLVLARADELEELLGAGAIRSLELVAGGR